MLHSERRKQTSRTNFRLSLLPFQTFSTLSHGNPRFSTPDAHNSGDPTSTYSLARIIDISLPVSITAAIILPPNTTFFYILLTRYSRNGHNRHLFFRTFRRNMPILTTLEAFSSQFFCRTVRTFVFLRTSIETTPVTDIPLLIVAPHVISLRLSAPRRSIASSIPPILVQRTAIPQGHSFECAQKRLGRREFLYTCLVAQGGIWNAIYYIFNQLVLIDRLPIITFSWTYS